MKQKFFALILVLATVASLGGCKSQPGCLGPDRIWRLRDTVIFYLDDRQGDGFKLDVAVRDLNTYCEGRRPVSVTVVGPQDEILVREIIEDDGVTAGDFRRKDGINDVFLDFRYRAWHRHHSPNRYPPDKERSPFLARPDKLPARVQTFDVAAAGSGTYKVMLIGCMDHYVSVTPNRELPAGIASGAGPLFVPDTLTEAYLYVPKNAKDLSISLSEEIEPFECGLTLSGGNGEELAKIVPKTFMNYLVVKDIGPGQVCRLEFSGVKPGVMLHVKGVTPLLASDPETARRFHAGFTFDEKNRIVNHPHIGKINAWVDSLAAADLTVNFRVEKSKLEIPLGARVKKPTISDIGTVLKGQNLDPSHPDYGKFADEDAVAKLSGAVAWENAGNPYFAHPALLRRIMLALAVDMRNLSEYYWYGRGGCGSTPANITVNPDRLFGIAFRSHWYPMLDVKFLRGTDAIGELNDRVKAVPDDVMEAFRRGVGLWASARALVNQGECSNQWCEILSMMTDTYRFTGDEWIRKTVEDRIRVMTDPRGIGRINPDLAPFDVKNAVNGRYPADSGMTDTGFLTEACGWDASYSWQQVLFGREAWKLTNMPEMYAWLNKYFEIKTHLTLPLDGTPVEGLWGKTCCPTDLSFRTGGYTLASQLTPEMRPHVKYGFLWSEERDKNTAVWPCLEEKSFVRNFDNRYYFLKTPAYYAIVSGGPTIQHYSNWCMAEVADGHADLVGYTGMHYTGLGRKATKPGGISALFVPGAGPTWKCINHDVMYTNTVWGRRATPICAKWEDPDVDPYVVAACYADPEATLDAERRVFTRIEKMMYAPLTVTRTVRFGDAKISIDLEILAADDVGLKELYETIPYVAEKRTVTFFDGEFNPRAFDLPAPIVRPDKYGAKNANPEYFTRSRDLPNVRFRAFDVAGTNGHGMTVVFDRELEFVQTRPLKHRAIAIAVGSFSLPLEPIMKKGETRKIGYAIHFHDGKIGPAELKKMVAGPAN